MVPTLFWYMAPSLLLSFLGASFIMLSLVLFREYREKSAHHLVIFCVALTDLLLVLPFCLILFPTNDHICHVQAFMNVFGLLASATWSIIFAISLLLSNLLENQPRMWVVARLCVGWGLPLGLACVCAAMGLLGPASVWCWIEPSHHVAEILLGLSPGVIAFMVQVIVFVLLMYNLHRSELSMFGRFQKKVTYRLSLFLLPPLLCWTWAIVDRFLDGILGIEIYWVHVLHAITVPAQGLCNAVVYGWDSELRQLWVDLLFGRKGSVRHSGPAYEKARLLSPDQKAPAINVDINNLYTTSEQDYR